MRTGRTCSVWILAGAGALLASAVWGYCAFWKTDEQALAVIAKMEAAYANCKSYHDRIEVTTISQGRGKPAETKTWIANVIFARPASLRFEFSELSHGKQKLICLLCARSVKMDHRFGGLDTPVEHKMTWTGNAYDAYNGKPDVTRDDDLAGLVYSLMAPSEFTDHQIVGLLLPDEIAGLHFGDMKNSRILRSEGIDGHECFVLESKRNKETFWVDKKSFALRKVVESHESSDYKETKTQHLHPEFELPVRTEDFRFDPPGNPGVQR